MQIQQSKDVFATSSRVKYFSVDPSSSILGYALWDQEGILIKAGRVTAQSKIAVDKRITFMMEQLWGLLKENENIIIICEDNYFSSKQLNGVKPISRIQGALWMISILQHSEITFYYPNEWRKILAIKVGNRDEMKKNSIEYVFREYGIQVDDNVADAICIGTAYLQEHGIR